MGFIRIYFFSLYSKVPVLTWSPGNSDFVILRLKSTQDGAITNLVRDICKAH